MKLKALLLFLIVCCLTESSTLAQSSCGKRPLAGPPGLSRIMGGKEAPEGAWPWQVSIQINSRHLCGGTILNSLWVLTATHCFYKRLWIGLSHFRVVAGLHALSSQGEHVQIRLLRGVKLHEGYSDKTADSDVALLLLSSPLKFTNYVQPICLPYDASQESKLNFSHCFVTGWGSASFKGSLINTLQQVEVKLIDRMTCNRLTWYNGVITENMICAGLETGGVDACQGDSGGPLQCYSVHEERFYVVGVTSFGDECGLPNKPGVYARAVMFANWLNESQTSACAAQRASTGVISALLGAALMLR